jgi:dolichyl-phosphate beta-glucosyltransferase
MGVSLSLVIPAYNEAGRLPPYLHAVRDYLGTGAAPSCEVIVVDDGSSDDLAGALGPLIAGWPQLRLVRHDRNKGKGAAVRTGMLEAAGDWLLFADADGATPIEEEEKLRRAIENGADIAVGSRMLRASLSPATRGWYRGLSGRLFAGMVRRLFGLPVRDSQCGFKMFRREVGRRLFGPCRETGYLFDLEILARGRELGYRIAEIPVRWREVPGSKVRLFRDGWKMVVGLWRLRREQGNRGAVHSDVAPVAEGVAVPGASGGY